MRSAKSLLLLALLALAFVAALVFAEDGAAAIDDDDEYADPVEPGSEDQALLIAHKHVKESKIVQGCNMTVSVSLYNVGKGTAGDVKVEDMIPEGFELIEGQNKVKFGSIAAETSVGMEYIVIPRVGAKQFIAAPAAVQYTTTKQNIIRSLVSTTPFVDVLSTTQNLELYAVQIGKFLSLGVLRTKRDWVSSGAVILISAAAIFAYMVFSSFSRTRADARRRAAERDLGVAELKGM